MQVRTGEPRVAYRETLTSETVEEAIFSVQDTLGEKPVAIEKKISEPLPRVRADLAKLNQILFLLLIYLKPPRV